MCSYLAHRTEETKYLYFRGAIHKVIIRYELSLWQYQHMHGCCGRDVVKCQREWVLKHFVARDFAAQNFCKNILGILAHRSSLLQGNLMEPIIAHFHHIVIPPMQNILEYRATHNLIGNVGMTRMHGLR